VTLQTRPEEPSGAPSRWAKVLGTIGIVLGILIVIDQLDDVWIHLTWTEADWRRVFSAEIARMISMATRPAGFQFAWNILQALLGAVLIVGSVKLYRRRRSGVVVCRAWAWVAIAWALVELGWAMWFIQRHAAEVRELAGAGWQAAIALGLGVAAIVMVAYPVFLLAWLARRETRADWERWPA